MTVDIKPQSTADMMGYPLREFILIGGKDGVGKTNAIVSTAYWVEQLHPDATFYVIDSENKFRSALQGYGTDAPKNIAYYKVDNMNQVTAVTEEIVKRHKPGDWLAVESMSRIWERAQDLGYQAIAGLSKIDYMDKRRAEKGKGNAMAPTPRPDDLWSIVKGAHDSAFLDLLTQSETLNVMLSTIVAKPKPDRPNMKESGDRKAVRAELGIDVGLEGAPRLPYYMETVCLLDLRDGKVSCRVLRDNLSTLDDSRIEFDVPNRKSWAMTFWSECRNGEIRL